MTPPQPTSFGALLKSARRAAGLTQEQLAERAGYSAIFISLLERGERRPVPTTVELLADALALADHRRTLLLEAASRYEAESMAAASSDVAPLPLHAHKQPVGGFLGGRPEGPLVAREVELAAMLAALDALAAGAGRCVVLAGEPGIGKTRLAQDVDLRARQRGMLVATGRCYETQQTVALAPFFEALTMAYAAAPQRVRSEVPHRWPHVARLILELDSVTDSPPLQSEGPDEQQRLFWQVTGFAQALSANRPFALLMDDLHWADGASVALLAHLARHTRGHRVLVLGTYREEASSEYLVATPLSDLVREHLVERITVGRLSRSGTDSLVRTTLAIAEGEDGSTIAPEVVDLLHAHTGGIPFFILEVVQALLERGDLFLANGRWEVRQQSELAMPDTVRAVIGQRLSHLSTTAREVLYEASVLGQTFRFTDLERLQERAQVAWEMALDEAVTTGLLRETDVDLYAFHHALVQQVLYAGLPSHRKRRLHQAAGEALEQLQEHERARRAAEIAGHFLRADAAARAFPYLLLAGGQAEAVYVYGEAEKHLRTALEVAQKLEDQTWEVDALEYLGDLLQASAQYDEARGTYERALTLGHGAAQDPVRRAGLYHKIGNTLNTQKRIPEASDAYERAAAALGEPSNDRPADWWRMWLGVQLDSITLHYWQAHLPEMTALVERARPVIDKFGTPRQRAEFFRNLTLLGLRRELYLPSDETLGYSRAALMAAQEAGALSVIGQAQFVLGFVQLWRGDLEAAAEHLQAALELAERAPGAGPFGDLTTVCLTYQTCLARKRGQVDVTQQCAERSLASGTEQQVPVYIGMARANLAWVALRRGNHVEVETHGKAALAYWEAGYVYPFQWAARWPLLGVACARGLISEAIVYARELFDPLQQPLPEPLRVLADQAVQAWDSDQPETAASFLDAALELAREAGYT